MNFLFINAAVDIPILFDTVNSTSLPLGVFVGGANLKVVDEEVGKKAIMNPRMELGNTIKYK
jgi:hypothetical protein